MERLPGCPGEDELVMILKKILMILKMILMIDDLVEREPGCPGEDVLPGGTSPLETSPAQNLCSHLLWLFDEVLIPGKGGVILKPAHSIACVDPSSMLLFILLEDA